MGNKAGWGAVLLFLAMALASGALEPKHLDAQAKTVDARAEAQDAQPKIMNTQPKIVDARLTTEPAGHDLAGAIASIGRRGGLVWVGYSIPVEAGFRGGWHEQETLYLEPNDHQGGEPYTGGGVPADHAVLLFRLEAGKVERVRAVDPRQTLSFGGLPVVWLAGITPEESIGYLRQLALAPEPQAGTAVFLIALHRSSAAVPTLAGLAAVGEPDKVRENAAFWLANQRGHEGFLAVRQLCGNTAEAESGFRRKLAFDLTLSKDPEAVGELIRMAHDDPSPGVRQQAQFWLGVRGGKAVAASLRDDAANDPDAHTRQEAVFAVSRLPRPESTDKLIELARTSKDPRVRKQAVFWLGQSDDPAALAFLTRLAVGGLPAVR